jgi:hypothetical protein
MDEGDTAKIRELAAKLKVVADETKLGDALHAATPADLLASPEIGFVHRHLPDSEVYFVVNTSNHAVHAPSHFRVTGLNAAQWNPQNAAVTAPDNSEYAPYESRVLVFSRQTAPVAAPRTAGKTLDVNLRRLTDPDRFFSGTIPYEGEIEVSTPPRSAMLNFGEGTPVSTDDRRSGPGMRAMMDAPVREAAVVYVNGKRAGAVWCAPWEIDVAGLLKPGKNAIRVEVGNSALNVMAGKPLPDYKALNAKYGERFQPQEMNLVAPQPSGLLGQVRLVIR